MKENLFDENRMEIIKDVHNKDMLDFTFVEFERGDGSDKEMNQYAQDYIHHNLGKQLASHLMERNDKLSSFLITIEKNRFDESSLSIHKIRNEYNLKIHPLYKFKSNEKEYHEDFDFRNMDDIDLWYLFHKLDTKEYGLLKQKINKELDDREKRKMHFARKLNEKI